jgi:hydroxymethylpyrimidine pyrophosphatase-like HAD family hydrolase
VRESLAGILDLDFYIVTTGAQVLAADLTPFEDHVLDLALATDLFERYGDRDGVYTVVVTDEDFLTVGKEMRGRMDNVKAMGDVRGRVLGVSFECMGDEDLAHRIAADINSHYAGALEGFQSLGSVDVVCAGCSKGAGALSAKDGLGVRLIAGIGDSYNDLPLLEAADVAYTFHKAPSVVRTAADVVVGSVAEALGDFVTRS